MALLPSASVTIDDEAGAFAGGTGYCVVLSCVERNADITARVFASAKALLAQHGYSPGADYSAIHFDETNQPIVFVGLPTATPGVLGRQNASGVTGTSVISVAAGTAGYLDEVDAVLTVTKSGTIGVNGIEVTLSLDGGVTEKTIRLGTATSYTVPYVGIVINFAAGTLVTNDKYTFSTTAPMWDNAGIAAARIALAAQQKLARTWLAVGDVASSTVAGFVTTAVNTYETANDRFVVARINVRDHLPLASLSRTTVAVTGAPTLTFAEVGATGDTITRSAGSFVSDGFVAGMFITISGTATNNVSGKITAVTTLVLTLDTADLAAEGPVAGAAIVGSPSLTFAEVGATGDTITRAGGGSWLDDGFRVGDLLTITGSVSNNVTTDTITAVTSTVLTLNTTDLTPEVIGARSVTVVKGETMAAWVASVDAAFASVDSQRRIDIALGRGRKLSPITGCKLRRPASWAASVREYQRDIHVPTWRKSDGPLDGWDLENEDGTTVEFDERVDGGGLSGRFTCFRSYGNGPNGTFLAMSLTRAPEGSLLSRTHNMHVANLGCSVVQAETENAIGQVLVLKTDGRATEEALGILEGRINSALQIALLQNNGEGPRASSAVWRASRTDILNIPSATLTGVLDLRLNGTLEQISTTVKIDTAG